MANIHLDDSLANTLTAQANARGMTLQAYLLLLAKSEPGGGPQSLTAEQVDQLLDEVSVSGPSAGSYSRADIYREHD